jgi:hypothetical protein
MVSQMDNCPICEDNFAFCVCRLQASNDNTDDLVRLPTDARLRQQSTIRRMAVAYGGLGFSRRMLVDHLATVIFRSDRIIVDAEGRRVVLDDEAIDRAFRTDQDASLRWVSEFLAFQYRPPVKEAQARTLDRYRLLWLSLYLSYPNMAAAVVR